MVDYRSTVITNLTTGLRRAGLSRSSVVMHFSAITPFLVRAQVYGQLIEQSLTAAQSLRRDTVGTLRTHRLLQQPPHLRCTRLLDTGKLLAMAGSSRTPKAVSLPLTRISNPAPSPIGLRHHVLTPLIYAERCHGNLFLPMVGEQSGGRLWP